MGFKWHLRAFSEKRRSNSVNLSTWVCVCVCVWPNSLNTLGHIQFIFGKMIDLIPVDTLSIMWPWYMSLNQMDCYYAYFLTIITSKWSDDWGFGNVLVCFCFSWSWRKSPTYFYKLFSFLSKQLIDKISLSIFIDVYLCFYFLFMSKHFFFSHYGTYQQHFMSHHTKKCPIEWEPKGDICLIAIL